MILAIDSATPWLSIALGDNKRCEFSLVRYAAGNHSRILMEVLQEMREKGSLKRATVQCIAVGTGPGSFTGAKIAAIIGKTLAYSLQCPLVGIPTLAVMAAAVPSSCRQGNALVPVIFHKKGEVFWSHFPADCEYNYHERIQVETGSLQQCMEQVSSEGTLIITPWHDIAETFHTLGYHCFPPDRSYPDGRFLAELAQQIYDSGQGSDLFDNIFTLVPTYGSKVFLD